MYLQMFQHCVHQHPLTSPSRYNNASINCCCWVSFVQVLALWLHEASRVFEDRLTCAQDHQWFR